MANFVFDEGATAALSAGVDWVGTAWDCALYDNSVTPGVTSVWADLSSAVVAVMPFTGRALVSGAAFAETIRFDNVSPGVSATRVVGLLITRNSDNLLLAHIDQTGITPFNPQPLPIMGSSMAGMTYTFHQTVVLSSDDPTVVPPLDAAPWFRL